MDRSGTPGYGLLISVEAQCSFRRAGVGVNWFWVAWFCRFSTRSALIFLRYESGGKICMGDGWDGIDEFMNFYMTSS